MTESEKQEQYRRSYTWFLLTLIGGPIALILPRLNKDLSAISWLIVLAIVISIIRMYTMPTKYKTRAEREQAEKQSQQ